MKKIAFLGGGKVGQAMAAHVLENKSAEIAFIYDPFQKEDTLLGVPVVRELSEAYFEGLDLVVECATADVVKANAALVLKHASFLPFSMTAFREDEVLEGAKKAAAESGHTLYLPHGAILGLDGVFDGRTIIDEVSIETIKNPKSLGRDDKEYTVVFGRDDKEYTVVFDGTAREAAGLYPRNVNVHAALSLAGIGFDRTHSRIISDPSVNTNEHVIRVKGEGIDWTIHVTAFAAGAVSGKYVPYSACGSLDRILGSGNVSFV